MSQLWQPTSPTTETAPAISPPRAASPKDSTKQRNPGKRIQQIVKLRPEYLAEYKKCHAAVWPEVLKQIKECNIVDCMWLSLSPMWIAKHIMASRAHLSAMSVLFTDSDDGLQTASPGMMPVVSCLPA